MNSASLSEIKKALNQMDHTEILDYCLRLARFKKENKELLSYLIFESHDEEKYIEGVKELIDDEYQEINKSNLYWAKKSLRKILRNTNKFIRYSGKKQTEAELLIYYCLKMKNSGIRYQSSVALTNLFNQQIKKINKALNALHEDLSYDYQMEVEKLLK